MSPLSLDAPELTARGWRPPEFTIQEDPGRFVALEVATSSQALRTRPADGAQYWASWGRGLTSDRRITMPDDVWRRLAPADSLYYRAHSSAAGSMWVDHRSTLPDDSVIQAPSVAICDSWSVPNDPEVDARRAEVLTAAAGAAEVAELARGRRLQALVCLHRFSPGRPTSAAELDWAVAIAAVGPQEIRAVTIRLEFQTLAPEQFAFFDGPGALGPPDAFTLMPAARTWPRLTLGPFIVHRDNSPAPGDQGGTCIMLAGLPRCLYLARTSTAGGHQVLVPS